MRVVLDTNVLIDAASDSFSAPAKLMEAARSGAIVALRTPALEREYRKILRREVSNPEWLESVQAFLEHAENVREELVQVTLDDAEDLKVLKAAVGGQADYIVTGDHHLLDVGEYGTVRIVTPAEAWVIVQESSGTSDEWTQWATGLGIGV